MILSNNPQTYIHVAIYDHRYGTGIHKKYIYRWAGPSAAHAYGLRLNLHSTLWTKGKLVILKN